MWRKLSIVIPLIFLAAPTLGHGTDQAFVLLLPTGIYSTAGTAAVVLTVLILAFVPGRAEVAETVVHERPDPGLLNVATSLLSLVALAALIYIGVAGPRSALYNPLPLFIWSIWWICMPVIQALLGDVWRWINPWTGIYVLLAGRGRLIRLPEAWGRWPAIIGLVVFSMFQFADIAPDDPGRLAWVIAGYWLATLAAMLIFGFDWLRRGECLTVLFSAFARLSPFHPGGRWHVARFPATFGVFLLVALACGSFDGYNETFHWLGLIGINPLEFPGRSAVFWPTVLGTLGASLGLVAVFALAVWFGLIAAGESRQFAEAFPRLAITVLPIALGYHVAHYLTALLVGSQYMLAAASDPWASGADWLGLGTFYVSTGFLNSRDSVQVIWLTQAGAIVLGHVWAVILADRTIKAMIPLRAQALIAQAPLAAFMVAYTVFGLWLLSSPRGA